RLELRAGGGRLELLEPVRQLERLGVEERELLLDRDREVGRRLEPLPGERDLLGRGQTLLVAHPGATLDEGLEQAIGDARPAPAGHGGAAGRGAELAPLLRRQGQERTKLRPQIVDV